MADNLNREQIENYQKFAKEKLGFTFRNVHLLITALTHRSYVNEHRRSGAEHNERLEFLGDAILEMVVSDYLYRNFDEPEGVMTALRSALVRTEANSYSGEQLGYAPLVRLSRGQRLGTERAYAGILADCFEAVIGAIYLDKGYNEASKFVYKHVISKMPEILENESWRDPKSYFQELCQHFQGLIPSYRTVGVDGPDHARVYTIALFAGEEEIARATARSKQEAQIIAAHEAIMKYKKRGWSLPIVQIRHV